VNDLEGRSADATQLERAMRERTFQWYLWCWKLFGRWSLDCWQLFHRDVRFDMRLIAIVTAMALCAFGLASAQTPTPVQHPYGFDPYKPSDAELLRKYGSVLATQTTLLELRKLDPYKPSHAALLRALGGAIPLWAISYPSAPAFLSPFPPTAPASPRGNGGRPRSNRQ
jgi:hypothetical protein